MIYLKRWWSLPWPGKLLTIVCLPIVLWIIVMWLIVVLMVGIVEVVYYIITGKDWAT